uniref:NADH-ubiquinone oxidoreductase chain 3 n=1 Tax=Caligus clemensi TaxID=344056 RepID=E1B2Q4_CALCM|nr:NADH dehydrogenase subunit 3 [Caligus clemensi]
MLFMFTFIFISSLILSFLIMVAGYSLSFSGYTNLDKLSPFECGFNPNNTYRMMFSLQFFLISLIFLVFDLELVILFPFISISGLKLSLEVYLGCLSFIFLLGVGLMYEWMSKSPEWCS